MIAALVIGVVAVGGLVAAAKRRPQGQQQQQQQQQQGGGAAASPPANAGRKSDEGGTGLSGAGAAAAIGAAVGGAYGDFLQKNAYDSRNQVSRTAAPIVGTVVGAGAGLVLANVAGGALYAGLVAAPYVIVPAAVIVTAIIDQFNAVEGGIRAARQRELYTQVYDLVGKRQFAEAWALAEKSAKDGYYGLGFEVGTWAIDETTEAPLIDGTSVKVLAQLRIAYGVSQAKGDEYADLFGKALPWLGWYKGRRPFHRDLAREAQVSDMNETLAQLRAEYESRPRPDPARLSTLRAQIADLENELGRGALRDEARLDAGMINKLPSGAAAEPAPLPAPAAPPLPLPRVERKINAKETK